MTRTMSRLASRLLRRWFLSCALLLSLQVQAQSEGQAPSGRFAIRGASVHTVAGPVIGPGTVLVRDGRIEAVGTELAIPDGVPVVEAEGLVLTPGLFNPYTQLGLKEVDGVDQSVDSGSDDPRFSAALDVIDGLNPASSLIPVNRDEGLTRAMSAPIAGHRPNLIEGRGAVIGLGAGRTVAGLVTRPHAALFVSLGEAGASETGGSRSASLALLREALTEAKLAGAPRPPGAPQREALLSALDVEALRPALSGTLPVVVTVHRASDIETAIRLADEFGLRLIVNGGLEAHLLGPVLAERRIPVILDPTQNLPIAFEALNARADAAARLRQAGVTVAFAIADDKNTHNAANIRHLAGNAVARGLDFEAALAAITLNPARLYGLDAELGSIEPGKRADLVLWDGDPLEVTSVARQVWIDGDAQPRGSRQSRLAERYQPRR